MSGSERDEVGVIELAIAAADDSGAALLLAAAGRSNLPAESLKAH
jgi:hypothetical protein